MAKRFNPGRSADLPILFDGIEYTNPQSERLEFWTIYDRGDKDGFHRWKLSASEGTSVLGKANYTLNTKNGELWTNDDGSILKKDRPELFALLAGLAAGVPPPQESLVSDDDDPYGDLALNRSQKLTQLQLWNRALLKMRETELHWECRPDRDNLPEGVVRAPSWELGVRSTWFGIFRDDWQACTQAHKKSIAIDAHKMGTLNVDTGKVKPDWNGALYKLSLHLTKDMPQDVLDDAIAYIKRKGTGPISFDAYKEVLKHFYDGDYKPESYRTLAEQFDLISGWDIADDPREVERATGAYGDLL